MKRLFLAAAAASLSGCASSPLVEFGGVRAAMEPPARTAACQEGDWAMTHAGRFVIPGELIALWIRGQVREDQRELTLRYDLTPDGRPVNIRFEAPRAYLDHATYRRAIRNAADAIESRRYAYEGAGPASFATNCLQIYSLQYTTR